MKSKQVSWINCAKFVAILAVMIDHSIGVLYTNQNIQKVSFFSVSLFIIISGMLCYCSNERHNLNWLQTFVHSSKNIVIAYLVANAIYLIGSNQYFDVNTYLQFVAGFNLEGPFYFVLLYLQLMVVNRFIYIIVKNISNQGMHGMAYLILIGIVILFICYLTTNYTNVLGVYGGGGKILGGTYLFLFYIGMIISKYNLFGNMTLKKSLILSVIGTILWILWGGFCVTMKWHWMQGYLME